MHGMRWLLLTSSLLSPLPRTAAQCLIEVPRVPHDLVTRLYGISQQATVAAEEATYLYFGHVITRRTPEENSRDSAAVVTRARDLFGGDAELTYLASILALGGTASIHETPPDIRRILDLPADLPWLMRGESTGGMLAMLPSGRAYADSGFAVLAAILARRGIFDDWMLARFFHLAAAVGSPGGDSLPGARAALCLLSRAALTDDYYVTANAADLVAWLVEILEAVDPGWNAATTEALLLGWPNRAFVDSVHAKRPDWRAIVAGRVKGHLIRCLRPPTTVDGGAPRFLDSVDRQLLCSSLGEKTAQIDERGPVAEG